MLADLNVWFHFYREILKPSSLIDYLIIPYSIEAFTTKFGQWDEGWFCVVLIVFWEFSSPQVLLSKQINQICHCLQLTSYLNMEAQVHALEQRAEIWVFRFPDGTSANLNIPQLTEESKHYSPENHLMCFYYLPNTLPIYST